MSGSLFRSEEMSFCQLFLQFEAAYNCVSELGEIGLVQFKDSNPDTNAFQRKFVNEVRRCDEMERQLRFFEKEIKKDTIPILDTGDNPEAPNPREMIDLEATFEKMETELKEVNTNAEALKRNFMELTELQHILRKTETFFDQREQSNIDLPLESSHNVLVANESHNGPVQLGFVAGVILREKLPAFERMLWRISRGNVFVRQTEIEHPLEDPATGDAVKKNVFVLFFQGDQLKSRVKKICEGFRAALYPCPETMGDRREMLKGVQTRLADLTTVLGQTQDHRHRVLVDAAKNIKNWFVKVRKIKAIYHILNMFNLDVTQKCLIAECWCPVNDLAKIQDALRKGNDRSGSSVPAILNRMDTKEEPPTFNRTNRFTAGFQNIVDAYGVANYREMNPAPYTIITFPFLFAVMFGDAGHGLIMFLFALYLVVYEKSLIAQKITDDMFGMIFGGRYIVLFMGFFSIYTGFIYNDFFSKSVNIFGTSWDVKKYMIQAAAEENKTVYKYTEDEIQFTMNPNSSFEMFGNAYPFGLDPIWQISQNKLTFLNSYKMKLSIIFGVIHMTFGVFMSLMNHLNNKDRLSIICEFIPQVIFMMALFGYLIVLVFYKWIVYDGDSSGCAPSLLITLISMCLFKYEKTGNCSVETFYDAQQTVQTVLVIVAVICIPWMLLPKPFILRARNSRKMRGRELVVVDGGEAALRDNMDGVSVGEASTSDHRSGGGGGGGHGGHGAGGTFDFGEIIVNQSIHTIEYCLGCISNTASYLRLWALSLAHAQLSEVLWTMVMHQAFSILDGYAGCIIVFVIFAAWGCLTIGVLLIMEGLSAFLHALRLHWVEFQNKFYHGAGYLFVPFSFEVILELEAKATEEI